MGDDTPTPILPREGRKLRGHQAWTGAETEAEVSDGWGEPVNMIGGNLNGQQVRLAVLQSQR